MFQPRDRVGRAHVVASAHVDVRDVEGAAENEADHRECVVHDERGPEALHFGNEGLGIVGGEAHVPARHGLGRGVRGVEWVALEEIDEAAADSLDGLAEATIREDRRRDAAPRQAPHDREEPPEVARLRHAKDRDERDGHSPAGRSAAPAPPPVGSARSRRSMSASEQPLIQG